MQSNQPDELDRLLDEALASYSSAGPRPGLEQRVLSRVRSEDTPRRLGWWRWAAAIPVVGFLLLVAISQRVKPVAPSVEHSFASLQTPAANVAARKALRSAPPRRPRRAVNRTVTAASPLPKRSVFPLPTALSAEERAVVDLVARFPEQAREVLIEANQRSSHPIEIRRIEILPSLGGIER